MFDRRGWQSCADSALFIQGLWAPRALRPSGNSCCLSFRQPPTPRFGLPLGEPPTPTTLRHLQAHSANRSAFAATSQHRSAVLRSPCCFARFAGREPVLPCSFGLCAQPVQLCKTCNADVRFLSSCGASTDVQDLRAELAEQTGKALGFRPWSCRAAMDAGFAGGFVLAKLGT